MAQTMQEQAPRCLHGKHAVQGGISGEHRERGGLGSAQEVAEDGGATELVHLLSKAGIGAQ